LRKNIGLVSQDTYLFHGTVKDNILYGSFDKTDDEVIAAAKQAKAFEFIKELPNGFDTIVGERGQKLSGGQRQRISLARALIKSPSLYIFDEATSAIDNETEAEILKSLKEVTRNKTTLMIAHRLSTIMHAHKIIVLENGRITEQGSHEELLSKKGAYYALWAVQSGQY
jgi:ATP-binding cassette subfamily B protein